MLVFRRFGIVLAVAAGAALTIGLAPAASADDGGGTTYNWIGNTQDPAADNHSWGDKKNWDPQEVPKDGDSVVIELPPGRCAAHVDGVPGIELKNFTMQESGATGGCGVGIFGGSNIKVTGLFQWNGGQINAPMTIDGVGSIMGISNRMKYLTQTMDVTGTLTLTEAGGDGGLRIDNPSMLHIKPGGTLISTAIGQNDITYLACCTNPAHLLNEGTVNLLHGTLNITAVQFDQHGTLKVGGGAQLVTTKAPVTASNGAKYSGSGSWNIGNQAVARFTGTQNVESPFRLYLGGTAAAPGGRLGGTFTLAGTGGRLDWAAGRIEGNMTVAHGFTVRALKSLQQPYLYGRDYTDAAHPVFASVINHGSMTFADGSGYQGVENSRLVNAADGTITMATGTRFSAGSCCVSPELIRNQGKLVVDATSTQPAAVMNMVSLENTGAGSLTIAKGKQLQLLGGSPATLAGTSVSGGGRLFIATPTKVSGTVKINAGTNLAMIRPGSLNGNAIIGGTGSMVWSGGSISGTVTISTVAGLTIYPTEIKYVSNINGSSTPSSLRITAKTTFVPGTKAAVNRLDLGQSTLTLAGTTTIPNFVEFYNGTLVNTGTLTINPGAGGQVSRTNGEYQNKGTTKLASGTFFIKGGDYWQTAGTTDIATGATVTTYYTANKVLLTAGTLTGTGTIKTSLYNDKGTISPGSSKAGVLTVTGSFTQENNGKLYLDVAKSSRDRLAVSGKAVVGGTLLFRTLGAAPAVGTTQTVLTSSQLTWAAKCAYTSGAGSTTGFWQHVLGPKNLAVVRKKGTDTHC
jgi:hypothetical protein